MQTTFEFTLPHGYIDDEGNVHQTGVMRLSRAIDEIVPLRDPRVQANPAYATVIILARVIDRLGSLPEVSPSMVENFFAGDLSYLQDFYRYINKLEEKNQPAHESPNSAVNVAEQTIPSPAPNLTSKSAPPPSFIPQPESTSSLEQAISMTMGV